MVRLGSVSLAGAESGLWSVHGGNKKVPQSLLNASGAHLITEEVEAVQLTPDGRFKLSLKDNENDDTSLYDSVILATPLTSDTSSIKFEKFPQPFKFNGRFHRTVCTMVSGDINYKTFGFTDKNSVMDEIFTTNATLFFNSIGRNYPVDLGKLILINIFLMFLNLFIKILNRWWARWSPIRVESVLQ